MPPHGRRHRLVLYTQMLNHWWKYTLWIGIILVGLTVGLTVLPIRLPSNQDLWVSDWILGAIAGSGGYAIILSIFLISIRRLSYVQPFPTNLRLVTPFLRLDISYRRIVRASSVEMQHLFPISKYKGLRQRLLRPLASETAIVLDLKGWPLPRWALGLFLSPFFFPDKSPRLALLVSDWMDFSTDLESFRSTWLDSLHETGSTFQSDLLASITRPGK